MLTLAFESSAKAASVALLDDDRLVCQSYQCSGLTHSRTLLPMAESMLKTAGITFSQIDRFAVACGPGSFTGIRIGVSAVKGLAWGAEKPCVGVSTLAAMAWNGVSAEELTDQPPVFLTGDGAALTASFLSDRGIAFRMATENLRWQTAWGVGMEARNMPDSTPELLLPVYLRLSQAERERQARMNK